MRSLPFRLVCLLGLMIAGIAAFSLFKGYRQFRALYDRVRTA